MSADSALMPYPRGVPTAVADEKSRAELENFDALVTTHRPRIVRFLLGMLGDRDAAEDLAQECFLRAHQAASSFRGESSLSTWLTRIAINLATDYQRSRRLQFWRALVRPKQAQNDDLPELTDFADSRPSAERSAIARQQAARVWEAARRLSPRQRSVFLLRFVDEMDIAEIADATGLATGTVKVHLSRAVHALRRELQNG